MKYLIWKKINTGTKTKQNRKSIKTTKIKQSKQNKKPSSFHYPFGHKLNHEQSLEVKDKVNKDQKQNNKLKKIKRRRIKPQD